MSEFLEKYGNLTVGEAIELNDIENEEEAKKAYQLAKSGQEYQKTRRKYYMLPKHISKQFGKYRVGVQVNGKRYRKVTFDTLEEAISWRDKIYKELAKED